MEGLLLDVARAEKSDLEAELTPIAGPRATLQIRLAELSRGESCGVPRHRVSGVFIVRGFGVAALAAAMVFACVVAFQHFTATGAIFPQAASDRGVLPNPALTPGVARHASLEQVCSLSHEEVVMPVSRTERERVFAEYGISSAHSDQYEVDYLITPGLGGDDDIRNLWPEPYQPAKWNAHMKDALEERLHEMVCSHQLDLSAAQEAIATNWITAYEKYVEAAPSHARAMRAPFLPQTASLIGLIRNLTPREIEAAARN